MARGFACGVHQHRTLVPQESHHIWPLGYHGPNVFGNRIVVCCNGHSDIHYLLELMLKGRRPNMREYGLGVRVYARAGYEQVMAYAEALATNGTGEKEHV